MPAVVFQQVSQISQAGKEIEAAVGAGGGLAVFPVQANQEGGAAVFLRQTGGNDANNALMPGVPSQDDGGRRLFRGQHGDSLAVDPGLDGLTLLVKLT